VTAACKGQKKLARHLNQPGYIPMHVGAVEEDEEEEAPEEEDEEAKEAREER
jgi:hypothetical protein